MRTFQRAAIPPPPGSARANILKSAFTPIYRSSINLEGRAALSEQFSLFTDRLSGPEGLRYAEDFVSPETEEKLMAPSRLCRCSPFSSASSKANARSPRSVSDTITPCAA